MRADGGFYCSTIDYSLRHGEVVVDADEVAVFGVLFARDGLEEDGLAVDVGVEQRGLPVGLAERVARSGKTAACLNGGEQSEANADVLRAGGLRCGAGAWL